MKIEPANEADDGILEAIGRVFPMTSSDICSCTELVEMSTSPPSKLVFVREFWEYMNSYFAEAEKLLITGNKAIQ